MKTYELFEGQLRRGHYDYGYNPTSRDKALGHWYNNVLPALSRTFEIPVANFKAQSDYGYGFQQTGRPGRIYSTEKVIMRVLLRKRGLDADLIKQMFPKALKNELSKQLKDVKVSEATFTPATEDVMGRGIPAFLEMAFTSKYPQEWMDHDKQRYNISWT